MASFFKQKIIKLLSSTDIRINGERPWDPRVIDERFFQRVLSQGALGLGESYMDGWWEVQHLDQFIYQVLSAGLNEKVTGFAKFWMSIKAISLNLQKKSKAHQIGERHYDIGNDLYTAMLDKGMNYSCAYWKNAENLDQAQEAKLELICKKLQLQAGMKVLDIGCGWGGFAKYAASRYNTQVTGITVSKEQVKLAKEMCNGLPVEIRFQDYRSLNETFDRIVSIGMIEHVGYKNYRIYMETVQRCLTDEGLFLLHTIGNNTSTVIGDSWTNRYIFPDGMLPSPVQITRAIEGLFVLEDWHNFGADYDKTLMAWYENFKNNWEKIKQNKKYDERFYRMWTYYLLSFAGTFRARNDQLWQIVLSKKGVPGGYRRLR